MEKKFNGILRFFKKEKSEVKLLTSDLSLVYF